MKCYTEITLGIIACCYMVFFAGCGNKDNKDTTRTCNTEWSVEVFQVEGPENIDIAFPQYDDAVMAEKLERVMPLRTSYSPNDTAAVNRILNIQDFGNNGRNYEWLQYGDAPQLDLVIYNTTPVYTDTVSVNADSGMPVNDNEVQIGFYLTDKEKWQRVTSENIGRRLAISVNGKILSAPKVNCPIEGGGCAVTVPKNDIKRYLPDYN